MYYPQHAATGRLRSTNTLTNTLTAELGNSRMAVSLPDGLRAAVVQLGRLQGNSVDVRMPLGDFQLEQRSGE